MKKIGCFRKEQYDLIGTISVLQFETKARVVPNNSKTSREIPDYRLLKIGGSAGFELELGMGWNKYSEQQRVPYIDIILDDPALARSINAILWEDPNDGYWYLYWDRMDNTAHMVERLYVQEELKPQIGIRPITKITQNIMLFYPELIMS